MGACVIGCGKAVPELAITNDDLEKLVVTNDEWIRSRTGIESRRIAVEETTLDLALYASLEALGLKTPDDDGLRIESAGIASKPIDASSLDLIILTTITPDLIVPCNAAALKRSLGAENAIAFDINAACTGFVYGASIAESMLAASDASCQNHNGRNKIKRALIVSAERLSYLTDWQDRNTCVLFGDGAAAVVLEWDQDRPGIMSTYLKNEDDEANALTCKFLYDAILPFDKDGVIYDGQSKAQHDLAHPDPKQIDYSYINNLDTGENPSSKRIDETFDITDKKQVGGPAQTIYMNGQRVFKFAARAMETAVIQACEMAGISPDDLSAIIPHQANLRIIEFAAKRLQLPLERFQVSIEDMGNTSSSGLPIALFDAIDSGFVKSGDLVALVAFGGGLTSGAIVVQL